MEKISMKVALVIFLVVASVVSIEATRLLTEEALETVFLGESLPHGEEKNHFGSLLHCQKGWHVGCYTVPPADYVTCTCFHD
ncbi:hypothetical protein F2Q70_00024055 [Brassica cretica]|uniref:Uncharacterized protein n=4 Tax=Brassica TaxID=3705 RepID=A0A3N6Q0J1_BRACR|nr:hypothetical protein F2Q70_00024055 [Brassica cretica]KAF3610677.1 hypothetical protein DY000_02051549 [Brassica cretica]CAF1940423.1 unnamed protein product [Brassica napus]CDY51745.1 BnaA05g32690D [Brassica napus]VDD47431.1 unnamed protein product [Brassica oleracea]